MIERQNRQVTITQLPKRSDIEYRRHQRAQIDAAAAMQAPKTGSV
jgi:hypothetical protein